MPSGRNACTPFCSTMFHYHKGSQTETLQGRDSNDPHDHTTTVQKRGFCTCTQFLWPSRVCGKPTASFANLPAHQNSCSSMILCPMSVDDVCKDSGPNFIGTFLNQQLNSERTLQVVSKFTIPGYRIYSSQSELSGKVNRKWDRVNCLCPRRAL